MVTGSTPRSAKSVRAASRMRSRCWDLLCSRWPGIIGPESNQTWTRVQHHLSDRLVAMEKPTLSLARAAYAEKIRGLASLRSPALFRALSRVPREEFLGPAPWRVLTLADLGSGYRETSDPAELYDNVLVGLDPGRRLNNGEPAGLLRWLDSLELRPGERFLHVGCGVGYYTAIAAEALRPGGRALGVELDP